MKLFKNLEADDRAPRQVEQMLLGWAIFGLVLFALTKNLWLGNAEFPQVPLLGIGHYIPTWVDAICYVIVVTCFAWILVTSRLFRNSEGKSGQLAIRWPLGLFTDTLLLLVICNQHRLQPWAYLAWLTAIVVFFCKPKHAISLLRLLVIGIYLHSAITKFDHEFVTTLGLSFLKPLKELVGLRMNWGTADYVLAGTFPAVELLIAVGLFLRKTRRLAVVVAVGMHVALTLLLWRVLRHELPVLVWNVYFIWQVVVLFGSSGEKPVSTDALQPESAAPRSMTAELYAVGKPIAAFVVFAATLCPFLEPLGLFDHWPSWGLYAPRNSHCKLFVQETAIERLPDLWRNGAREYVDAEHGWTPGLEIGLGWKSLQELGVPIYPQDRFQLGVALAIVRKYGLGDAATVIVESASDRMTGQRERLTYSGLGEIESAQDRYWLNVEPRRTTWGE